MMPADWVRIVAVVGAGVVLMWHSFCMKCAVEALSKANLDGLDRFLGLIRCLGDDNNDRWQETVAMVLAEAEKRNKGGES